MTDLEMAIERLKACSWLNHWDAESNEAYIDYFRQHSTVEKINLLCDAEEK